MALGHSGRAGTRPALTSEDLPLPDAPITATNRRPSATTQRTSSAVSSLRPKKIGASSGSNDRKPG